MPLDSPAPILPLPSGEWASQDWSSWLDRAPSWVSPDTPLPAAIAHLQAIQTPQREDKADPVKGSCCLLARSPLSPASQCLWVLDQTRLVGVLSDRDVVRVVASGQPFMHLTLAEVLEQPPSVYVHPDPTLPLDILGVFTQMQEGRLSELPVVTPMGDFLGVAIAQHLSVLLAQPHIQELCQPHRQELERALWRYRQAIDCSSDAIVITDPKGRPLYQNLAFSRLYECETPAEFEARGGMRAVFKDPDVVSEIFQTLRNGHCWVGELEHQTHTGKTLHVLLRADTIHDPSGRVIGLLGIVTEMSDRAASASEQRRSGLASQEANQALELTLRQQTQELQRLNQRLQKEIQERRQTEEVLRASWRKHRLIVDSLKTIVFQQDLEGQWTFLNPAWTTIMGYSVAETLGTCFLDYLDPAEREEQWSRFQAVIQGRAVLSRGQVRYRAKNGHFRWVEVSASAMRAPQGQIIGVSGTLDDITDQRRAEMDLAQQVERGQLLAAIAQRIRQSLRLEEILKTAVTEVRHFLKTDRVVIYRFHPDWSGAVIVESAEPKWQPLLGKVIHDTCFMTDYVQQYREGRVRTIDDIYTSGLQPCHVEMLANLDVRANLVVPLLLGEELWGLLIAQHCSAPRQWQPWEVDILEKLAVQIGIAIQQADLYAKLEVELAERKQAEAEVLRALAKEKELSELKSRFIRTASHEFRTPLATIFACSDLLKRFGHKLTEEKKIDRLDKIQREVKHLTNLIEDILLLGKVEAGQAVFKPAPLELIQFCQSLFEELALIADAHQFAFLYPGKPENPKPIAVHANLADSPVAACPTFWVEMDEKLLRQILNNLLTNAVKYSPSGATVTLLLSWDDQHVTFQVKDEGIGIAPEDQAHLFEEFYRASSVSNLPGTGLGLAIVKSAVDLHQGTIQVESQPGVGTTFTVRLPIHPEK
ncbi:ATP-binding protein [Trichothermofontia sp.]